MGARHPRIVNTFNPTVEGWQRIPSQTGSPYWVHTTTGEEMEEYKFVLGS